MISRGTYFIWMAWFIQSLSPDVTPLRAQELSRITIAVGVAIAKARSLRCR